MEPTNNTSLVDLIQNDPEVITVAEAKSSKTKSSRQVNLTTILAQLSEFTSEEIMSYPINTIRGIKTQGNRISSVYAKGVEELNNSDG